MATTEELYTALRNADAAGDTAGAQKLAAYIQSMPADKPTANAPATQAAPKTVGGLVAGTGVKADASGRGTLPPVNAQGLPNYTPQEQAEVARIAEQQMRNIAGGAIRGPGSIGSSIMRVLPNALGGDTKQENADRRTRLDENMRNLLGADTDSGAYQGTKLGTEILGTLGAGGLLANTLGRVPMIANNAGPVLNAISSSGATANGANGIPALAARVTGGAISGGAQSGMTDPANTGLGAFIGGGLPVVTTVVGKAANTLGALLRPFTSTGQDKVAGATLREFAENPENALTQLLQAKEVVKGSTPTTAMAAGDNGIAALSRAMQNADPRFASELAARQTAQNQARTVALESIAGNDTKIALAKDARNALTSPMRESVLDAAKGVKADPLLSSIDDLISKPDNAGKLSQQALQEFRTRIAQFSQDGAIDARALYAIRKDINDVLGGKLQGEAGNLKQASSQLIAVKGLVDDAIDKASKAIPSGQTLLASGAPKTSWSDYLQTYAKESIPIGQMEKLDKVMKAIQTGSVDSQGGLILSGAKLNNILKNEGGDLVKSLSPEQMDILRRVSADLNAGQIAATTGRAVGSNTLQNMAQNNVLSAALGKDLGGSTAATSTLGRLLNLPYGTANKQIQEKLGNALLDPKEAARILQTPEGNKLLQYLTQTKLPYKLAPAIAQ